jgi:hypothetical protein
MTSAATKVWRAKVHLYLQGFVIKNVSNCNSDCSYLGSLFNEMTHRIDQISSVTLGAYTSTAAVTGYGKLRFIYIGKILPVKMLATAIVAVLTLAPCAI